MTFTRDPDSVLDYVWDWSDWLAAEADTIVTSLFIVPTGLVKVTDSHTTTTCTVWLSGGTAGVSYLVTNRITTTGGRTEDHSRRVYVQDL